MTPARFRLIFPAFDEESDERIQLYLDMAAPFFDKCRWDNWYEQGLANYTAHSLVLSSKQTATAQCGANGAVMLDNITTKKVGDVSVTRSDGLLAQQAENPLLKTVFGQEYLRLRRLVGMGALAV